MILDKHIIDKIKEKSHLEFDQAKDFDTLSRMIIDSTGRTMGVTTLKRLMGYINDERKTNEYTLNTLALFLGFSTWASFKNSNNIDSEWNFVDDAVYIKSLDEGSLITIKYLDRVVDFTVVLVNNDKVLKVNKALNSSLDVDDILFIESIKKGESLVAAKIIRGDNIGNYKTNGSISEITIN